MMTTDYWDRAYMVRIETSHFSGTFTFDTAEAAFGYLFDQFARVERIIRNREYANSWVNFDCQRSRIVTPHGTFSAEDVLLVSTLSSSQGMIGAEPVESESDESIDRAVIAYREIGEYAYDGEPESVEEEADYQDWRGR